MVFASCIVASLRLNRKTPAASRAERINSAAPVNPGVPMPTRMVTVERTNPVLRANCGKSVMCLYETRRMMMSERIDGQQDVHTGEAARQGFLLLHEASDALVGVFVVF